jgi:hypothetical protein
MLAFKLSKKYSHLRIKNLKSTIGIKFKKLSKLSREDFSQSPYGKLSTKKSSNRSSLNKGENSQSSR